MGWIYISDPSHTDKIIIYYLLEINMLNLS